MEKNNSSRLEWWRQVFVSVSPQVERAEVDSSSNSLNIFIRGRDKPINATGQELDDDLHKFNNNVQEVVISFMKKHEVLFIYQNTLVAYFDIQAYSTFIEKTNFKDAIWKVNNLFSEIKSNADTDAFDVKLDCWILSDSIIITVDTNRALLFLGSLEFFFGTCSTVMAISMRHGFPLRGAIGGGDFFKDGDVMVSTALVDAVLYEKEQNWLGAVLTPKAYELVKEAKGIKDIDFSSDRFNPFIRFGEIRWKEKGLNDIKKPQEWYYIKPYHMADEGWASKYLLDYFDKDKGKEKIENSHSLYGQK